MACTTVVAVLLVATADGRAASVVVTVGDRSTTFTQAQLTAIADIAANDWQPGAAVAERHPDGVALRRLIESAGGDLAAVRSVTLTAEGAAAVDVPGRQLEDPPPFGSGPPIPVLLWSDGEGIHFARPVGGDLLDRVDVATGATLTIAVSGGERLDVAVRASTRRTEAGAPVTLTAVADGPATDRVTYRWELGDGRQGRGPQLQHVFRRPGRFNVTVTATAAGASGSSDPVEIVVGRAPPATAPERPAETSGGRDGADDSAPPSDTAAEAATPSPSVPQAPAAPPADAAPRRRAPAPAPARGRPSDSASEAESRSPTVSGELVASTAPAPPPPSMPANPVRATATPGDGLLDDVPWQALAVVALLTGGALIEWRYGRRGVKP